MPGTTARLFGRPRTVAVRIPGTAWSFDTCRIGCGRRQGVSVVPPNAVGDPNGVGADAGHRRPDRAATRAGIARHAH